MHRDGLSLAFMFLDHPLSGYLSFLTSAIFSRCHLITMLPVLMLRAFLIFCWILRSHSPMLFHPHGQQFSVQYMHLSYQSVLCCGQDWLQTCCRIIGDIRPVHFDTDLLGYVGMPQNRRSVTVRSGYRHMTHHALTKTG